MATRRWIFRCEEGHYHTIRDEVRWSLSSMGSLPVIDGMELPIPDPGGDIVSELNSSHLIVNVMSKRCPQKYNPAGEVSVSMTMQKMMETAKEDFKKEIIDTMEVLKAELMKETNSMIEVVRAEQEKRTMEMIEEVKNIVRPDLKKELSDMMDTVSAQLKKDISNSVEKIKSDLRDEIMIGVQMSTLSPEFESLLDQFLAQRRKAAEADVAAEADLPKFPDLREKLESQKKTHLVNLKITKPATQSEREVKTVPEAVGLKRSTTWEDSQQEVCTNKSETEVAKKTKLAAVRPEIRDTKSNRSGTESSFAEMIAGVKSQIPPRVTRMCAEFVGRPTSFTHKTMTIDYIQRCAPIVKIDYAICSPHPRRIVPQTETLDTLLDPLTNTSFITGSLKRNDKLWKKVLQNLKPLNESRNYIRWLDRTPFNSRGVTKLDWYSKTSHRFTHFELFDTCEVKIPVIGSNFLKHYHIGLNSEATEVLLMKKDGDKTDILKLPITHWVILTEKFVRDKTRGILGAHATPDLISMLYYKDEVTENYVLKKLEERGEEVRKVIWNQWPKPFTYGDVTPEYDHYFDSDPTYRDKNYDTEDGGDRWSSFQEQENACNTQ